MATHAPRDVSRLFILEKNSGNIRILDLTTGLLNPTPFLTIADVDANANEAGLLGLAFHPDYANNGKFYVNVTVDNGGVPIGGGTSPFSTHIREYTRFVQSRRGRSGVDARDSELSTALWKSQRRMARVQSRSMIFCTSRAGDGGSGGDPLNNGQSLDTLLGKMLRIDVNGDDFPTDPDANYAIPPSNPFVGTAGAREEIWAYGLRNPWRDSFDRRHRRSLDRRRGTECSRRDRFPSRDQRRWRKLCLEPPRRVLVVQRRMRLCRVMSSPFTTTHTARTVCKAIR